MPFLNGSDTASCTSPDFKQTSVFSVDDKQKLRDTILVSQKAHEENLRLYKRCLENASSAWAKDVHLRGSPYPVVVPRELLADLETFNDILVIAITNIVDRWWEENDEDFSRRMPIEAHFEDVLKWIASPVSRVGPFHERRGCWRPDLLYDSQEKRRNLRVCEINARFAFNGFFISSYGQESLPVSGMRDADIEPIIDYARLCESYSRLIDERFPVHLVKGREYGIDIYQFQEFVRRKTGTAPRFIAPGELRLVQDENSPSGYRLACLSEKRANCASFEHNGERVEYVHQCALELHQSELLALSKDMLKTLAPICFNDLRTIFLVHDKRLLGIILQSIESLVSVHSVLTPEQGVILRAGILHTVIPGSPELNELITRTKAGSETRNNWLLKPTGAGKGEGILFGDDFDNDESWLAALAQLQTRIRPSAEACLYVVQQMAEQPKYNILLPEQEMSFQKGILVHTYLCIGGEYLGLGIARTSAGRIAAVSHGGAWIPTVRARAGS